VCYFGVGFQSNWAVMDWTMEELERRLGSAVLNVLEFSTLVPRSADSANYPPALKRRKIIDCAEGKQATRVQLDQLQEFVDSTHKMNFSSFGGVFPKCCTCVGHYVVRMKK